MEELTSIMNTLFSFPLKNCLYQLFVTVSLTRCNVTGVCVCVCVCGGTGCMCVMFNSPHSGGNTRCYFDVAEMRLKYSEQF